MADLTVSTSQRNNLARLLYPPMRCSYHALWMLWKDTRLLHAIYQEYSYKPAGLKTMIAIWSLKVKWSIRFAKLIQVIGSTLLQKTTSKKRLYGKLTNVVYETLLGAILFYQRLSCQLYEWGYKQNPYDPCIFNKTIDGQHMTIQFHVDNLGMSHMDQGALDDVVKQLNDVLRTYKKRASWNKGRYSQIFGSHYQLQWRRSRHIYHVWLYRRYHWDCTIRHE